MLALQPQAMHLTHYASVGQVERLGQQLLEQIDAMVAIAREQAQGDAQTLEQRLFDALSGYYAGRAEQAGLSPAQVLPLLAIDIRLNAQGLVCWLQRGLD
jgi:hypothetical protein